MNKLKPPSRSKTKLLALLEKRLAEPGNIRLLEVWNTLKHDFPYTVLCLLFREVMSDMIVDQNATKIKNGTYKILSDRGYPFHLLPEPVTVTLPAEEKPEVPFKRPKAEYSNRSHEDILDYYINLKI